MSIDSDDNFDDDIDKLLDEIDTAGSQKPKQKLSSSGSGSATVKNEDEANNESTGAKLTLNSDGNGLKVNYGGGGGFKLSDLNKFQGSPTKDPLKSVRFTSEATTAAAAGTQQPKSNFISSLLQKDHTGPAGDFDSPSQSPIPPASSTFMSSTPKNPTSSSSVPKSSSDWLGLDPSGGGESPTLLSPKRRARQSSPFGVSNNSTINFDDDDVGELLQSVNPGPPTPVPVPAVARRPNASSSSTMSQSTAKKDNPSSIKPKSGFELDDDFWPKPSSSKPVSAPPPTSSSLNKTDTFDKPETGDFRSRLLQKAAMSRGTGAGAGAGGEGSGSSRDVFRDDSPFEATPSQQQHQPSQQQSTKSIVDVLPFLSKKPPTPQTDPESLVLDNSNAADRSYPSQNPQSQPATTTTTKTVRVTKKAAAAQQQQLSQMIPATVVESHKTTLQLPSHLIDEEELKTMCNSLKTLYMTQLDMQEKSYHDQMECLSQSHLRKEELLREEIKLMHKEYDARLERLKNELLDTETKVPQRLQNELSAMANFSQQLQQQAAQFQQQQQQQKSQNRPLIYTPNSSSSNNVTLQNQNATELLSPRSVPPANSGTNNNNNPSLVMQDLQKMFEEKLTTFVQSLKADELQRRHQVNSSSETESKELSTKLDVINKKLDSFAKFKLEEESKKNLHIIETEKDLHEEIIKLNKQQKRIKESVVKAAVASITQALQYSNDENLHKKDKMASQLKEFRKDVRRILYDLETKNEVVQKSHVSLESDQKQIMKSLRDIQTLIQVNSARVNLASEFNLGMTHGGGHYNPTMMTSQSQQQGEMELKLLKEERNALSDQIAQINVERRKINEEKISLERDKMDFEREKNRLRDLEVNLRVKTAEAEDMKKQAEEMRKVESNKAVELTTRVSELERERAQFKDQHYSSEQRLRIREQKLIQEKTELMREKEFLEKLREQSLCPGCMKTVNQFMISRSDGDGIDISTMSTAELSSKLHTFNNAAVPVDTDAAYFQKESMYLDDLYYNHYK